MEYNEINKEVKKYAKKTKELIHKNPVESFVVALTAGFFLGKICSNFKRMFK